MTGQRLNPTLLHKLLARSTALLEILHDGQELAGGAAATRKRPPAFVRLRNPDAYNEPALRANIRHELSWLLNTQNFGTRVDLDHCPQTRVSVLNYGVADLTGKAYSRQIALKRVQRIKEAIAAFEPRLNGERLKVDTRDMPERDNAVTYDIDCEIVTAVEPLDVRYVTNVEADSGAAVVRE